MPSKKELLTELKSYGLKGLNTLSKSELIAIKFTYITDQDNVMSLIEKYKDIHKIKPFDLFNI